MAGSTTQDPPQNATDSQNGNGEGKSLEDLENERTEHDGQVSFVWEHGRKVPISSIVKRGTDVEYKVKFGGVSVKGRGEPIPLETKDMLLIGRYYSGGLNFVPSHDDEGNVDKVTIYATIKPQGPPVDVTSPEGRLVLGSPSIVDAVRAAMEDGADAKWVKAEVDKALKGED